MVRANKRADNSMYRIEEASKQLDELRLQLNQYRAMAEQQYGPYALSEPTDQDFPHRLLRNVDDTLGPWVRWFMALHAVIEYAPPRGKWTSDQPLQSLLDASKETNNGAPIATELVKPRRKRSTQKGQSTATRGLSLSSTFKHFAANGVMMRPVYEAGTDLLFVQLLERLNEVRAKATLPNLTAQALVSAPSDSVCALDCLERFRSWLVTGSVPAQARLPEVLAAAGSVALTTREFVEAGEAVIEALAPAVASEPEAAENGLYANLYCRGTPDELRAIAAAVAQELLDRARACGRPLGVEYVSASSVSRQGSATSPADLLERLCKTFRVVPDEHLRSSAEGFDRTLSNVRRALTLHSTLVVVDGIPHVSGVQAGLLHVMADRDWESFIRMLVQPDWGVLLEVGPRLSRSRSCFLVLSDGPLKQSTALAALVRSVSVGSRPAGAASPMHTLELSIRDVALAMIAASIDGLRQVTLRRCIERWVPAIVPHLTPEQAELLAVDLDATDFSKLFDELANGLSGQLVELDIKTPVPGIDEMQRQYELQDDPVEGGEGDLEAEFPGGTAIAPSRRLLVFGSEATRRECLLGLFAPLPVDGAEPSTADYMWWTANWALAEESLAQATSALRQSRTSATARIRGCRRMLQTLYHGLCCGSIAIGIGASTSDAGDEAHSPTVTGLPPQPADRLRYLYAYLYRTAIEGEEWVLTRSLARSDVRVGLLPMFIARDPRRLVRADADDDRQSFLDAIAEGWCMRISMADAPARDLLVEIMVNLATAAVDCEQNDVARLCIDLLRALPPMLERELRRIAAPASEVQLDDLLPGWSGKQAQLTRDLEKLELDLLDAADDVDSAISKCKAALVRLVGDTWVQRLEAEVVRPAVADLSVGGGLNLNQMQKKIAERAKTIVEENGTATLRQTVTLSALTDIVFRLADYVATKADKGEHYGAAIRHRPGHVPSDDTARDSQRHETLLQNMEGFVHAWVLFCLADRVRAMLSVQRSDSLDWSSISARPYRVYVRVSLKISRLLAELARKDPTGVAQGAATKDRVQIETADAVLEQSHAFLLHGQGRANVYVRHLHLYARERFQALLLQATIVRAWVNFHRFRQMAGSTSESGASEGLTPSFGDAENYLHWAEDQLFELGAPEMLSRRLLLERVSVLIGQYQSCADSPGLGGLMATAFPDDRVRRRLITLDLNTLDRMTVDHPYWRRLYERQAARWHR